MVLDPFAGSNTTGLVAEMLRRRWLAFEIREEYLAGSAYRFEEVNDLFSLANRKVSPHVMYIRAANRARGWPPADSR